MSRTETNLKLVEEEKKIPLVTRAARLSYKAGSQMKYVKPNKQNDILAALQILSQVYTLIQFDEMTEAQKLYTLAQRLIP